jgi:hypothetical protein
MPDLHSLALVPLVFGLSAFGPGYWLVRRLHWRPLEKATAALALSVLITGLVSFAIGVLRLHPACRVVLLAASGAATLAALHDLFPWHRDAGVRRALAWFAVLIVWVVSLQSLVRSYSGGNLVHDWLDHYERSKFFLGWQPIDALFSGALLTARPPLANAFAAQMIAVTQARFPCYELTAALLGVLAYVPMLLVARLFSGSAGLSRTLAIMLMFQPMFVQNVSYSWTRMPAVFFVLSAVGFYVAGWRARDHGRILFAFVCGAGAILTHYSSFPCVLFLALHYLFAIVPGRDRPIRDLGTVVLATALVLAPWLAWATAVYGARTVVSTAFTHSDRPLRSASENLTNAVLNLRDTFVPHVLRDAPRDTYSRGVTWGRIRDDSFTIYQGNLPFALGSLGAVLLAIEALRSRNRSGTPRVDSGWFWAALAAFAVLVGIGVQGGHQPLGLAHTAQQPLVMLGVAFLASRFDAWPPFLRRLAAVGLLFDACLGVLVHFWLQSYPFDLPNGWRGPLGLRREDLSFQMAYLNWRDKLDGRHLFVADLIAGRAWIPAALVAALLAVGTLTLVRLAARRDPET